MYYLATYRRTLITLVLLVLALAFAFSNMRLEVWADLRPFFEWMETTWFGVAGKTWGALFAVVEAFHLLAMALMGGAVILTDGRLLGLIFADYPARPLIDKAHKLFVVGLLIMLLSGVFMACGVAMKVYYLEVFWYKMLVLGVGILFVFCIKRPLLAQNLEQIQPWILKLLAVASLLIWFTVAAAGRWIGFA